MKVTSLARQTDLIFSRFSGEVHDRGDYVLVRTPSNPGFHWGNYIIFSAPPRAGDLARWKETYRREFSTYDRILHMTFTWLENGKPDEPGAIEEFLADGFTLERGRVLAASRVNPPPKICREIQIRKLGADEEWEQAIRLQILNRNPVFGRDGYERFKRRQFEAYRAMSRAGIGDWFGAFIGETMVGDLGIYHEDGVGRFQMVGTHPDFRRRGICGTLVFEAAQQAFRDYGVRILVMEADDAYHAAAIYESVGFKPVEINRSLSWWID